MILYDTYYQFKQIVNICSCWGGTLVRGPPKNSLWHLHKTVQFLTLCIEVNKVRHEWPWWGTCPFADEMKRNVYIMSLLAWRKNTFNFNESITYLKSHHQIAVGGDVFPFRFQVMSPLDCLSNGQGDTKEVSAAERLPYAGPISQELAWKHQELMFLPCFMMTAKMTEQGSNR